MPYSEFEKCVYELYRVIEWISVLLYKVVSMPFREFEKSCIGRIVWLNGVYASAQRCIDVFGNSMVDPIVHASCPAPEPISKNADRLFLNEHNL
jgi:hypothetical protein